MSAEIIQFQEDGPRPAASVEEENLILELGTYEGPLDVLLALAREQKVDLARISILALADQYLAFVERAKKQRLELAADYLVMAAWLAYLKSKLLLPVPQATQDAEPSAVEMAEALAFQLRRLEAMRAAGERLLALPQFGRQVFPRGEPEGLRVVRKPVYELTFYELLKAYGGRRCSPSCQAGWAVAWSSAPEWPRPSPRASSSCAPASCSSARSAISDRSTCGGRRRTR